LQDHSGLPVGITGNSHDQGIAVLSSLRPAVLVAILFGLERQCAEERLVIMLLYGVATEEGAPLVTLAGAVFIFPFFVLSALGGELADKYRQDDRRAAPEVRRNICRLLCGAGFYMHSIPLLFVALALFGVVAALFGPVKYADSSRPAPGFRTRNRQRPGRGRDLHGDPDRHHRRRCSSQAPRIWDGFASPWSGWRSCPGRSRPVSPSSQPSAPDSQIQPIPGPPPFTS
jgi:hypothetical protein